MGKRTEGRDGRNTGPSHWIDLTSVPEQMRHRRPTKMVTFRTRPLISYSPFTLVP